MHVNRFLFYPNSTCTLYLNIFLCSHIIILATWLDHRQLEKSVLVFFFFKKKIASIKRKKTLPKSDKVTELKCKGISSIYTCKLLTCVCPTRFWAIELSMCMGKGNAWSLPSVGNCSNKILGVPRLNHKEQGEFKDAIIKQQFGWRRKVLFLGDC